MERINQRALPVVLIALALLLVAARVAAPFVMKEKTTSSDLVEWVPLARAHAVARAQRKPILYNFTADWCAPCHLLEAEVFCDPALAADINRRFVPVKVVDRQQEEGTNTPEVQRLQLMFSVRAFPTLVVADRSGAEHARMEGFRDRAHFEQVMRAVP